MVKNIFKRGDETPAIPAAAPVAPAQEAPRVQIVEREVSLSLLNEKVNLLLDLVVKLCDVAGIKE